MQQLVEEVDGDELIRYGGSVLQITKMPEPGGPFHLENGLGVHLQEAD